MLESLLEEALKVARDKSPERRKYFMAKIDALQNSYIHIIDDLRRQTNRFESKARELDLMKNYLEKNGGEE